MLKLKDSVELETLRNYGFKTSKEWVDEGSRFGNQFTSDFYIKYEMYIEKETGESIIRRYSIAFPTSSISIDPNTRIVDILIAPINGVRSKGEDLDFVADTLFQMTKDGLLEILEREYNE